VPSSPSAAACLCCCDFGIPHDSRMGWGYAPLTPQDGAPIPSPTHHATTWRLLTIIPSTATLSNPLSGSSATWSPTQPWSLCEPCAIPQSWSPTQPWFLSEPWSIRQTCLPTQPWSLCEPCASSKQLRERLAFPQVHYGSIEKCQGTLRLPQRGSLDILRNAANHYPAVTPDAAATNRRPPTTSAARRSIHTSPNT